MRSLPGMKKPKRAIFIERDGHRYQVVKLNKETGDAILRGDMRDFFSNLHKAEAAGYRFLTEA